MKYMVHSNLFFVSVIDGYFHRYISIMLEVLPNVVTKNIMSLLPRKYQSMTSKSAFLLMTFTITITDDIMSQQRNFHLGERFHACDGTKSLYAAKP